MKNNLLNLFAQNVLWGRYKNDKLAEICLFKDGKLTHLAGNLIFDNQDATQSQSCNQWIAMTSQMELKDAFETFFPLFDLHVFSQKNCR